MMKLPELKALENYHFPELILKFVRDYQVSQAQATMLFQETKKMLWLMVKHLLETEHGGHADLPETFNIHKPMEPLDKMWHEFILFTKEYHQFCALFFGSYIHHVPCSEEEYNAFKQRALEQKEEFIRCERDRIGTFVKYIQKNLGDKTLRCWFKELPALEVA